jgi:hypothetical protein
MLLGNGIPTGAGIKFPALSIIYLIGIKGRAKCQTGIAGNLSGFGEGGGGKRKEAGRLLPQCCCPDL